LLADAIAKLRRQRRELERQRVLETKRS